jgi:serine/threonine protein kinase
MRPERWRNVSDAAKDFVNKLLVVDPVKRMSASEAIAHEWIQTRAHAPSEDLITDEVRGNMIFFDEYTA